MKMRERRMHRLEEKLQLTDAQKQQIQAIWDKAEEQGRALRAENHAKREEQREKARDLMKSTHDQVRAVLTADQQKTFDSMDNDRPHRRMKEGAKPADAPKPEQP
jgi:Spy/CpxP family protein refolding chaperone